MGTEIERKFLLKDGSWRDGSAGLAFRQGYLSRVPGRTVRVRVSGDRAWLTIKGRPQGLARPEYEYEIPASEGRELLELCEGGLVEKVRFRIPFGGLVWEIDVFEGSNQGLVLAEVELPSEDTVVALPPWAGPEVTGDPRYANSSLAQAPFRTW